MTPGGGKAVGAPILVWNPNPTLDVVNTVPSMSPGTVHRADRQLLSAGGKGTLVVRALHLLGAACEGIAPLAGATGSLVQSLFAREALPFRTSSVSGQTRLAITINEGESHRDTVVNGPGPETGDAAWEAHLSEVRGLIESGAFRYFVIAGRPPLSVPTVVVVGLMAVAHACGLRTVYDMSYPFLDGCLVGEPWLVKVNASEARQAQGDRGSQAELVTALLAGGARNAVLTDGPEAVHGDLLGVRFVVHPPRVGLSSAVGAGDCFFAGLLAELACERDGASTEDRQRVEVERAVRTATAVASASAENAQPGYFSSERARILRESVAFAPVAGAE